MQMLCTVLSRASTHGRSRLKNWGWALTWRRCLNSPTMPVQVPTPDPKLTDRHYWIDSRPSFARASFLGKWGQHASRESCILVENKPTLSFVAIALQRSLLALREFCTASKEHCRWGYNWCVQTLLPDVVAPETHRNTHPFSKVHAKQRSAKVQSFICQWKIYVESPD